VGEGEGVSLASGVTLGLGEGEPDSVGEGDGVGEDLRFFFLEEGLGESSGEGLGEDFFVFGEGETLGVSFAVGDGLGVAFFLGEGDFSADAVGFGEGDFWGVAFFFDLRGAGVGVGAKIFFNLVPNDSSALVFAAPPETSAMTSKVQKIRMERERSTDRDEICEAMHSWRRPALRPWGQQRVHSPWGQQRVHSPAQGRAGSTDGTRLFLRQLSKHRFVQPNTALEVLERKVFIRRMRTAIGQREAHQ
jgi:hypothetical protein